MNGSVKVTRNRYLTVRCVSRVPCYGLLAILSCAGCQTISSHGAAPSGSGERQVFVLKHIEAERGVAFLSKLGLGQVHTPAESNAVAVSGSLQQLHTAGVVLDIVDQKEDFVVENLGPASMVRALPSNSQLAAALGEIAIGTFANPPQANERARGIIDVQGDSVVAILPARHWEKLLNMLARSISEIATVQPAREPPAPQRANETSQNGSQAIPIQPGTEKSRQQAEPPEVRRAKVPDKQVGPSVGDGKVPSADSRVQERIPAAPAPTVDDDNAGVPKTIKLVLEPAKHATEGATPTETSNSVQFENGDDILELSLPEALTLGQLLDLAGKHLHLDYVYMPQTVGNQSVALKLHGGLASEMRIKDLYALLETVLKFNGLVMIRREQRLVTIVPAAQALDADPSLLDASGRAVQAGDTVVTRMFELRYVDVTSVTSLLQNMKLGMAVSTSPGAPILFVTCYAQRMGRIEQLVNMLDRPGRPKECRFRCLQYTAAPAMAEKVRTMAQQLQGVQVATSPGTPGPAYLDADERTNRIVMIGYEEQLTFLEDLVGALDVTPQDLRIPRTYTVKHMTAQEALSKLQELEVLGPAAAGRTRMGAPATRTPAGGAASALTEEPVVAVLEATNQLLVTAVPQQHARIEEFLGHVDVSPEDLRTLHVYEIRHVEAQQVKTKLEELAMTGASAAGARRITAAPAKSETTGVPAAGTSGAAGLAWREPQIIVNESTNSLLVNATADQHARIAATIDYVDRKMPAEEVTYRIYPLENSSPDHVAGLVQRLIQEAAKDDKESKVEKPAKVEKQITIVPDPNTFSLIVHATEKNQKWIEELAKNLDKRRPQVLIDVTLVEITRTDTFEYDLNLVASTEEAVIGNIGIEPIHRTDSETRLEGSFNLRDQDGNPTGQTKAFYSDKNMQALLTAIQRKNYGRVLAKPKVLVDDGQKGEISTTDGTTYQKESIQIPNQGSPITTRDFEPIEAKIQLQITPHISEGDLLRLDVHLAREDFGTRPAEGAPPDKATSEVTTTVFVPDNHTVILGGLVKLNQSKGGSKVPVLGDIPLVGALFRSVDNSDVEKKLYVFLRANVVRPYEEAKLVDLEKISEDHRRAFEESEAQFQEHEDIPGIKPEPMSPEHVLDEL